MVKPAVFASENFEIPIFFALFQNEKMNFEGSSFGTSFKDGKIILRATKDKIEYFKKNEIKGWVYIFEKKDFFEREKNSGEVVAEKEVVPVDVVEVKNEDLVLNIEEK